MKVTIWKGCLIEAEIEVPDEAISIEIDPYNQLLGYCFDSGGYRRLINYAKEV